jgi:pimeloyl-ACP methyl ester carboxylesterase
MRFETLMQYNKKLHKVNRTVSKQKILIFLCLSIAIVTSLVSTTNVGFAASDNKTSIQSQGSQGTTTTNNTKMNIVLVHGAWVDAASWNKVIPILQKAGYRVIAVELPLHSLADDVATVKRAIDLVGGPVTLVGHSYGGEVITNAGYNNPNVKSLVYRSAFAPKEGQRLITYFDPTKLPPGLLVKDNGGFLYINPNKFHDVAAQDVDPAQTKIFAAAQKPINSSIFAEKSGLPAWSQHRTWYAVSANDKALPPDIQRMFAKQINATTISVPASHASYISHPTEIAELILNATKGK